MERPSRAGQAADEVDENAYVGRGCAGSMGVYVSKGANTFWNIQYSQRLEGKTGVAIERDVPGQYVINRQWSNN